MTKVENWWECDEILLTIWLCHWEAGSFYIIPMFRTCFCSISSCLHSRRFWQSFLWIISKTPAERKLVGPGSKSTTFYLWFSCDCCSRHHPMRKFLRFLERNMVIWSYGPPINRTFNSKFSLTNRRWTDLNTLLHNFFWLQKDVPPISFSYKLFSRGSLNNQV